jgi:hypothetical protein
MNSSLFHTQSFPVKNSNKLACVITGYGGKIKNYKSVVQTLNNQGFAVIAYEHSLSVLSSGNPNDLLELVDGTCNDFASRIASYKKIICVGASAGAGLCFAMQRRIAAIQYGVYAVAGIPGKDALKLPLFYFVRRRFHKHGFDAAKLNSLWRDIDISPDDPPEQNISFVMVLGKRDRVVNYEKALATLQAWQSASIPIKIITQPKLGHFGTIKWYKEHIEELLTEGEQLTAST